MLLFGYKYWKGTRLVEAGKMDIWTGRRVEGVGAGDEEMGSKKKVVVRRARDVVVG